MTGGDFSRQSFLGPDSTEILANTRIVIVGLGGGGSHIAQQAAHVGVGEIRIIDPDSMEDSNLNRLVGATAKDVEGVVPKIDIARRVIAGVRPEIRVIAEKRRWQEIPELLIDSHVIFGCIDGYQQRGFLELAARRYGVPYIDIGMDVTQVGEHHYAVAGQMIQSLPGAPCMRCMGFLTQERLDCEENNYGAAGGNPQVVWTNGTLASLAMGALMQLVTPWGPLGSDYVWLELDGNRQVVSPSRQPNYCIQWPCTHFVAADVGDPFFKLDGTDLELR
jgi:hypothetical protein